MTPPLPSTLHLSPPFLIPPLTPPTLPEADPYIGADMSSSFLVTSALNTTLHIASTLEASFNPLPDASPPLSLLQRHLNDHTALLERMGPQIHFQKELVPSDAARKYLSRLELRLILNQLTIHYAFDRGYALGFPIPRNPRKPTEEERTTLNDLTTRLAETHLSFINEPPTGYADAATLRDAARQFIATLPVTTTSPLLREQALLIDYAARCAILQYESPPLDLDYSSDLFHLVRSLPEPFTPLL